MKEKTQPNILFGNKLTALRLSRKLSQEQLALKCGFNRTYIGTLERAEKSATVNTIYRLAEGLEVEPKEFFE